MKQHHISHQWQHQSHLSFFVQCSITTTDQIYTLLITNGFQDEREEAEGHATGGKEPATLVLDPNVLLENTGNSMAVGGQVKVPLKVTSLNFDTMCASQPQNHVSHAPSLAVNWMSNGGRGAHGVGNQVGSLGGGIGSSQKLWEQLDSKQAGPLIRNGNRGENKPLPLLPFRTLSKNTSPGKERNHISICEPCPKKSSGQTI